MSFNAGASPLQLDPVTGAFMLECAACRTFIQECDPPLPQLGRLERLLELRREIEARRGNRATDMVRFSRGFVMEQAAERYYRLISQTQENLRGRFDDDDFSLLLNADPSPVWDLRGLSLASLLQDTYESEDEGSTPAVRELIRRLGELTPLEEAAILDACERVLRGYSNPVL
jgi:hypothetical protein